MQKLKVTLAYLKELIQGKRIEGETPKCTYHTFGTHQLSEDEWKQMFRVSMLHGRVAVYMG